MADIQFDHAQLRILNGANETIVPWDQIKTIVFQTTSVGPSNDDQFLQFEKYDGTICVVSLNWTGSSDLLGVIAGLVPSDTHEWLFAKWTADQSVMVWPSISCDKSLVCRIGEVIDEPHADPSQFPDPKEYAERIFRQLMWRSTLWTYGPIAILALCVLFLMVWFR